MGVPGRVTTLPNALTLKGAGASQEMTAARCGEHKNRGEMEQERRAGFKEDLSETYSTYSLFWALF